MVLLLERFGLSRGIRFSILAVFIFSLMNICIKKLPHIPAIEIVFFRTIISFFVTLFALKIRSIPLFGSNRTILLLRGLCGTLALLLLFTTIQNIPLATAVIIFNLSPLFTALLAYLFCMKKCKKYNGFFGALQSLAF